MRRRAFIAALGCAAAWPLAASAQQAGPTKRVSALMGVPETNSEFRGFLAAVSDELTNLAAAERLALQIDEPRWSNADPARARTLAAETVATKPDVIFASTTPVVRALHEQRAAIPIVFTVVSDPIGARFVDSLNRPGGNTTGFVHTDAKLGGKWLALLKEAAPALERVAIMFNPDTAPGRGAFFLGSFEAAAKSLGVEPLPTPVHTIKDIEAAVAALGAGRCGLVLMDDSFMGANDRSVMVAAAHEHVPTISPVGENAADGGLMSYRADIGEQFCQAAGYVDRILRGEKPADLPVQTPTNYRFAINRKTANALGLDIPPSLPPPPTR